MRRVRSRSLVMEDEALLALRSALPQDWVIREYRPDHGLDLVIEVFFSSRPSPLESLGERLFVHLRAVDRGAYGRLTVYPHPAASRRWYDEFVEVDASEGVEIETLRATLDTADLERARQMGAGSVVLLIVVDLARRLPYHVCLNDYIDKILQVQYPRWHQAPQQTIHIPTRNAITNHDTDLVALRNYARRAKVYAALQVFVYQHEEIEATLATLDGIPAQRMLRAFLADARALDIWRGDEWALLHRYWQMIEAAQAALEGPTLSPRAEALCRDLWRGLAGLGRHYEEVVREWFLPTHLAQQLRY